MKQPADLEALVRCASRMAEALGVETPARDDVVRVVREVVDEREALIGVEMGVITPDEAVLLLLAHFHSALFANASRADGDGLGEHPDFLDQVRQALIGAT